MTLSQAEITKHHEPQNPPGGLNKCCCGEEIYCPGSILICEHCLEDTVKKSSTEPTLLEDTQTSLKINEPTVQIEWDELRSELVHDSYNSRLCNTSVEPRKVNLQPSPSPPPAVFLPQIRDPRPSQGDGIVVQYMGNGKYHDVALQAANEPLASVEADEDEIKGDNCKRWIVHCGKNNKKNKKNKKKKKKKKKKTEEAMRNEEYKKDDVDKEIVAMAQVNQGEWCKATANANNTQVHNAASGFQICSRALQQFLTKPSPRLPVPTVLVESSFETPQEPLVLSTHQLHLDQGLNLSSIEKEQMTIYQAIKGISDRDSRHVIILTTLPNIDQWAVSLVECVNRARECIRTEVKEGRITLKIRHEDEVEVTDKVEVMNEVFFQELTWGEGWDLIEDEVKDEVNGGDKMEERDRTWEHLEPDCPEKKEATMTKSRQAITRCLVLTYPWTTLYHLVTCSNTPPKHIKIDDEERQLSDQYCSFPHRPRSCLIPILKRLPFNLLRLLILLILLLLAYFICSDEFLSGVYIGSRTRSDDPYSEAW